MIKPVNDAMVLYITDIMEEKGLITQEQALRAKLEFFAKLSTELEALDNGIEFAQDLPRTTCYPSW